MASATKWIVCSERLGKPPRKYGEYNILFDDLYKAVWLHYSAYFLEERAPLVFWNAFRNMTDVNKVERVILKG
jgi:hypothetical protein